MGSLAPLELASCRLGDRGLRIMFAALPRSLLRNTPALALAGGATLASVQFRQPLQCNQQDKGEKGVLNVSKGTVPIAIGQKFLQLYFAESADKTGKISLHSGLSFDQAKTMLVAAGAKPKECQAMFDLMDTDNSGTVDFCEIMVYFLEHGKGSLPEKGSMFFH